MKRCNIWREKETWFCDKVVQHIDVVLVNLCPFELRLIEEHMSDHSDFGILSLCRISALP